MLTVTHIHYDSASTAQKGLGKTDLAVPFWAVVMNEVYDKIKKKVCICFNSCS